MNGGEVDDRLTDAGNAFQLQQSRQLKEDIGRKVKDIEEAGLRCEVDG